MCLIFYLVVAIATMFVATKVNAQEFKFGAKGGLNLATFNGKDADDAKMRVGFHLGAVAEYAFNEQMAIQSELLFSAQGAKGKEKYSGVEVEEMMKLNYISLPVMFKYYVMEGLSIQV